MAFWGRKEQDSIWAFPTFSMASGSLSHSDRSIDYKHNERKNKKADILYLYQIKYVY